MNDIVKYLDEIIPNPKCELNYSRDYELLLATMLSAQTTDKRVNEVTSILFDKYGSIEELAMADVDDIKKIIKPIGMVNKKADNLIKISKEIFKCGFVPNDRIFLESLPGVGRKTANVVLSNLYGVSCIAVDTHVARVSVRLGLAKENDDVFIIEKKLTQRFKNYNLCRIHHQLVLFGRYYCKSRNPLCDGCKFKSICIKK